MPLEESGGDDKHGIMVCRGHWETVLPYVSLPPLLYLIPWLWLSHAHSGIGRKHHWCFLFTQGDPRTCARRSYAITLTRIVRVPFGVSLPRRRLTAPASATHLMSICRSYVTIKYVDLAMMPRDFGMIGKASAPSPRPGHSALEQVNCRRGCRPSGCAPLSGHRPGLMDCERGSPAPSWQLPTLLSA